MVIHERGFIQHTDHREAAMAAVDAVYPAARNAMAFPHLVNDEALAPHVVDKIYLFFTDKANAWVDVSDTLETKLAALREHVSQLRKPEELEGWIRGRATEEGKQIDVAAAEGFRYIDIG